MRNVLELPRLSLRERDRRWAAVRQDMAARDLDCLARLLQRFQAEDMAHEETERAGDVVLQRRRTENTLGAELFRHFADHPGGAEQAVVGVMRLFVEAHAVHVGRILQIGPQIGG